MSAQNIDIEFRVCVETRPQEVVCVVGDDNKLGKWLPHRAQRLRCVQSADMRPGEEGEVWSRIISLPVSKDVQYRYFTSYIKQADNEDCDNDITITRWETNIRPRVLSTKTCQENGTGKAVEFGFYDGKKSIDKGWLLGHTEIQLRLHSSPIKLWKSKTNEQQYYKVKSTHMDLRYRESDEDEASSEFDDDVSQDVGAFNPQAAVSVAVLKEGQASLHEQGPFGETFCPATDYMVFKAQTTEPEFISFKLEIYLDSSANSTDEPMYLGYAYLLPVNFQQTTGVKSLPINGPRHKPIGQIAVDYLIIKPLKKSACDMKVSYANHWKQRRPLDVGHRGMGNSYSAKKLAVVRENTIASLSTAGTHGADYVEFDVQLSKDLFPIIYHDFSVVLTLRKKTKGDMDMFSIPVKDLNMEQLQSLKTDHHTVLHDKSKDLHEEVTDHEDHLHFPTLSNCFQSVDPHVGFNVEIKYPQSYKDGSHEMDPFFEMNMYVDIILEDILKNASNRRIILSCFHPDICTMLKRKQNKYPVLFLTKGQKTERKDFRCDTLERALYLTICENYLGIDVYTSELMDHLDYVQRVKAAKLVLFVWGAIDDADTLNLLRRHGVDGIIYDRIQELKGGTDNIFKMEQDAKMQLPTAMASSSNERMEAGGGLAHHGSYDSHALGSMESMDSVE
ncbi:glycerophosphocholine phosphodiesterase GPCPD1-like isoform X2 [Lineus longissimus]|uniref:glycerophosphocholine phosphodiesterase GPCPD1-like isoform X2 n=1 Tax=Lineus longissimus TaxID=88925 RepID=UPI00315C851A